MPKTHSKRCLLTSYKLSRPCRMPHTTLACLPSECTACNFTHHVSRPVYFTADASATKIMLRMLQDTNLTPAVQLARRLVQLRSICDCRMKARLKGQIADISGKYSFNVTVVTQPTCGTDVPSVQHLLRSIETFSCLLICSRYCRFVDRTRTCEATCSACRRFRSIRSQCA